MNEARFKEILAAYGANPGHWPQGERAAALAFRGKVSERDLQEAAALDALLNATYSDGDDAACPDDLMRRIIATAPQAPSAPRRDAVGVSRKAAPARSVSRWVSGNRFAAASFAFAMLLGLAIGTQYPGTQSVAAGDAEDELVVSFALAEG